ncbi:unnamed protein product [Haemonchus placei]|uniref:Uncharacterized protein n=1 Tax=Haemonchus placei TaxID=6290 RepID=A0A0N4WNS1_HAEPC|nr:unnamed protein product [Haemonchus placei]
MWHESFEIFDCFHLKSIIEKSSKKEVVRDKNGIRGLESWPPRVPHEALSSRLRLQLGRNKG